MIKLAVSLATLVPCLAAFAQSTVTIYGVVDAAATYGDPGRGGKMKRLDSGVGPGSRIGFRGVEDLGDGLRANFTLESGLDSGTGVFQQGGTAWGRQVWVGLGGNNWSLTAGRQYGPNEIAITAAEAQAQNYWGSSAGWGIGTLQSPLSTAGSGCQGATVRINNSVQGTYTLGGWTGKLMVAAGDENERSTGRFVNPNITYSAGPLMLTAGYARFKQCAADIPANASPDWQTETVIGGSYDLGVAKLFAGYYNFNPSEDNKTVTATTYVNHKVIWLGTRVPVGNGIVIAQLARLQQEYRGQGDGKGLSYALTYEHSLSKRTRAYVSAAYIDNNDRARFGLAAATATQAAGGFGANPKALSVGVSHLF